VAGDCGFSDAALAVNRKFFHGISLSKQKTACRIKKDRAGGLN
jgi:hypothetical protein